MKDKKIFEIIKENSNLSFVEEYLLADALRIAAEVECDEYRETNRALRKALTKSYSDYQEILSKYNKLKEEHSLLVYYVKEKVNKNKDVDLKGDEAIY